MNYLKIYDEICRAGKNLEKQGSGVQREEAPVLVDRMSRESLLVDQKRPAPVLVEHLIIPAGIWGSSRSPDNIVYLTKHQQLVAYKCLARIHPTSNVIAATLRSLIKAFGKKRAKPHMTSRRCAIAGAKARGRRIPHTAETRMKMSASHKGKTFSAESRKKMSDRKKGMVMSEEHVRRRNESRAAGGRWFSEESIEKMRVAALNRRKKASNTTTWSVSK